MSFNTCCFQDLCSTDRQCRVQRDTSVRNGNMTATLQSTATLCYLQLPLGIPQCREQVQFDPGLSAQAVLQVLGLLLHG